MSRIKELEKQMAELQAKIDLERKLEETPWPPVFKRGDSFWKVTGEGKTPECILFLL